MKTLAIVFSKEAALTHASLCALAGAKILALLRGASLEVLVLGEGAAEAAGKLSETLDAKIYYPGADFPPQGTAEGWSGAVAAFARERGYGAVSAPSTSEGKDFMPRVAALLDAGMVSDVCGFDGEFFLRYAHAGNAIARVSVKSPCAVLTLRETSFEPFAGGEGGSKPTEIILPCDSLGARILERREHKTGRPPLAEARNVIGVGRGVKNLEGMNLAEELADLLGAAIGGSRAAVDEGFLQNDLQIGQTGKTVAPKLYLACGISGAIQHTAGIKDSRVIAAINKDPEAPIFALADYGLVADFAVAAPVLIEKLKKPV